MGVLGFNQGLSDQLQKIMESRLKAQQQAFENDLKLKEEQRKSETHAADLEFKREQLAQAKQVKDELAADKLQKNLGAGGATTAEQDKRLSSAGLPVAGGISLPSTSIGGFGTLPTVGAEPAEVPQAEAPLGSVEPVVPPIEEAPATMPQIASAAPLGTMVTRQNVAKDQRVTDMPGPRIPTSSPGSAEMRQEQAIQNLDISPEVSDEVLFNQLRSAGYDPVKAANTVKSLRPAKETNAQSTNLLNPATKNAVVFNAQGSQGAGYYDVATQAFVPAPQPRPTGDSSANDVKQAILEARLDNMRANAPDAPDYEIRPGTNEDKIAQKMSVGDIQLSDFYAMFGRAAGASAKRREAILLKAMEYNPAFNPADFKLGFQFANNARVRSQIASLNNVAEGIPDMIRISDEAARSGMPILNQYISKVGYNIGGKPYANLRTARIAFADELSGALGYGSATDMSREMGMDITDPNLSPDAFSEVMQRVVEPFIARKKSTLLGPMGPYASSFGGSTSRAGQGTLNTQPAPKPPSQAEVAAQPKPAIPQSDLDILKARRAAAAKK